MRKKLIDAYLSLKQNLAEAKHESAGLAAGKLCEATIRHLQDKAFGSYTPFGKKIPNFADEARKIITASNAAGLADSEKLIIPRCLVFLYTMRNQRGIGHIGGDVDPNQIDAATMGRAADWVICELIRVHHALSLEEAQDIVDSVSVRTIPDVWEVAGKRRVLREGMKTKDEALLLLYSASEGLVLTEDLVEWVEYSNASVFKSNILSRLHKDRMLEWNRDEDSIVLSPKGAKYVEDILLKSAASDAA